MNEGPSVNEIVSKTTRNIIEMMIAVLSSESFVIKSSCRYLLDSLKTTLPYSFVMELHSQISNNLIKENTSPSEIKIIDEFIDNWKELERNSESLKKYHEIFGTIIKLWAIIRENEETARNKIIPLLDATNQSDVNKRSGIIFAYMLKNEVQDDDLLFVSDVFDQLNLINQFLNSSAKSNAFTGKIQYPMRNFITHQDNDSNERPKKKGSRLTFSYERKRNKSSRDIKKESDSKEKESPPRKLTL